MKFKRFNYETVTSTNDFAKELLQTTDCVIVTANYQTRGRGRNENSWFGDFGQNVYFSLGIRHNEMKRAEDLAHLQGLGCLAVLATLRQLCPHLDFRLKYPNDVYVRAEGGKFKKISGILIEHQFVGEFCYATILGIGINVNQMTFPNDVEEFATSLKILGCKLMVDVVVDKLIDNIQNFFSLLPWEVLQKWFEELNIIGKKIFVVNRNYFCEAVALDNIGRLVVRNQDRGETLVITDGDSIRYEIE
ncbi:MAG: biotin--[acetyl-CoA-carboxylase] ligase [Candidatus Kapaibacteriota bacterium]